MNTEHIQKISMAYHAITDEATLQDLLQDLTRCIVSSSEKQWLSLTHQYRSLLHRRMMAYVTNPQDKLHHYMCGIEDDLLSKFYDLPLDTVVVSPDINQVAISFSPKKLTESQKKQLASKVTEGEVAYQRLDYDAAILAFSQALMLHPKHVPALKGRSLACLESGQRHHDILQDCAIIRESNATLATFILGHYYLKQARFHEASQCFDGIFKRLTHEERVTISQACVDVKQYDLAYLYCCLSVKEGYCTSNMLELLIEIGSYALRHQDWVLAKNCYSHFIGRNHPFTFCALFNLSQIEASHGSYINALSYLLKAEAHPDFEKQSDVTKSTIQFGLLLCYLKLNKVLKTAQLIKNLSQQNPLWKTIIAQFIIGHPPGPTDAEAVRVIYLLGDVPDVLRPIIQPFFRFREFSPHLVTLFINLNEAQIKSFVSNIDWNVMLADQLNKAHTYYGHTEVSALVALLCNPHGALLLFLSAIIRNKITEEGLNMVHPGTRPLSALFCLMHQAHGINILRKDPILCDKISVEGFNGDDFDLTKTPSPLLLCVNSIDGQHLIEKTPSLRSKITRAGLIAAIHFAQKNQWDVAYEWLMREIKRPEYQSLLMHHQMLLFKSPSVLPQQNTQQIIVYSPPGGF